MAESARHELKCVPPFFQAVIDGTKTFEARKHDRPFAEGDTLLLREWNGDYTGRECERVVSYVLVGGEFGIERGYVVMGLRDPRLERVAEAARRLSDSLWDELLPSMKVLAPLNDVRVALAGLDGGDA